jgi:hypothetical protein
LRIFSSKQLRDAGLEAWKLDLHDVQIDIVVDRVVAVDYAISQTHILPPLVDSIGNAGSRVSASPMMPRRCLTASPAMFESSRS